jgi:hypothetical protein
MSQYPHPKPSLEDLLLSRRELLRRSGTGLGALGLAALLQDEVHAAGQGPLAPRRAQYAPKAKQVVHLFMNGGPSQTDTFDPKPELQRLHGKPLPATLRTERKTGAAMGSPFKFQKYGRSGIEVSELFQKTASACIDDLCVIRSMYADVPNHEPSLLLMNCGDGRLPRPSMGSWVTYGLGSENQNLPGFVAMCPGGLPVSGVQNWRAAFLPGAYQGTYIDTQHTAIEKLLENIRNEAGNADEQRKQLDVLNALNRRHLERRAEDDRLEVRIQSFELAYRMQVEATDAFDVSKEPAHVLERYGPGTAARQLLITRRLLERGVRFVQVWSGGGQPWDNHDGLEAAHRKLAGEWDPAIAAFLTDLKQRGMLDSTLVLWGGEFGRTPVAELPALSGRDHNHYGFSVWLAGGGARGGYVHGATDEFGFKAEQDPVHVHDLHATMLHLLGFDHTKLTYRYAGRDFRLTDVHGRVIRELLG